jgi:phage terminase large subunit-like protein
MCSHAVGQHGGRPPRVASVPAFRSSAGPEAVELAATTGLIADPWQRYVMDCALGEDERGNWTASEVGIWIPRQNGKGTCIELRVLAGLFLFGDGLIVWSAHEYKTVERGYRRIRGLIQRTPELHGRVRRYWDSHGEQGIELATGERLLFVARSRSSIRGFTAPTVILDEAQYLTAEQMAAQFPVMATLPNYQIWYLGTPPDEPDAWIYDVKEDGESGRPGLLWLDWGLDLDLTKPTDRAELDNRKRWYQANPGLPARISESYIEAERRRLKDKFAPERLGVWRARTKGGGIIDPKAWARMADTESRRDGDVSLGVAIAPLRDYAAIGLYGARGDGLGHLQLVDYRPGTEWIADRLAELREALNPVAIGMSVAAAASLRADLDRVDIRESDDQDEPQRGDLMVLTPRDVSAACGQIIDAVRQETFRHLGQQPLDDAVGVAKTRPISDTVSWAHKDGFENDICALESATDARYVHVIRAPIVVDYDPMAYIF